MTMTSGRAWAATATASRAELASAQTTTSSVSAVADDLVVVDQHDPQGYLGHERMVSVPPVWLKAMA
jgi:hypothetical protein